MKKVIIPAILASIVLAGCSNNEFLGYVTSDIQTNAGPQAIMFQGNQTNMTRAALQDADAAKELNNEFIVYGTLNNSNNELSNVFNNFRVHYNGEGASEVQDTSKVYGWSYLFDENGNALYSIGESPAKQALKYWDLSAKQYDFVAFSGVNNTVNYNNNYIRSTNNYGFKLTTADMGKVLVSNKIHIIPDGKQVKKPVMFTFFRMKTKVRVGFYETIPGYAVSNVRFYYGDNALSSDVTKAVAAPGLRATVAEDGQYNVTYDAEGVPQAALSLSESTIGNTLAFQSLGLTSVENSLVDRTNPYLDVDGNASATAVNQFISETIAAPTWAIDTDANGWKEVFPYANKSVENGTIQTNGRIPGCENNLVLRMDFDLVPLECGENPAIIHIYNASAVVPASWAQWKPNYAYTYIFKITDNIKGSTTPPDPSKPVDDPNTPNPDPDPSLYPIVFDAEVSSIEDYNEEYITGVTALGGDAITTYSPKSNILNAEEYTAGDSILLSSITKGRWRYTYVTFEPEGEFTENGAMENFEEYAQTSYTVLAGDKNPDDPDSSIDKEGTYGATLYTQNAGYYIVELRYLPWGKIDDKDHQEWYANCYKVIKVTAKK